MALELHVIGAGLEVARRLEPAAPALVLGRDAVCAICLPDPERKVSRRHLSVWNEGEQLHFHVLSVVNGARTRSRELPPGARGVLEDGEVLAVGPFRIWATPVPAAAPADSVDTWARLQRQAEQLGPEEASPTIPGKLDEDPFEDSGFGSSLGARRGARGAGAASAGGLAPFFRGLGLGPTAPGVPAASELETLGRLTRIALEGLLQASQAAAQGRQELRAEDAAAAPNREESNPLRRNTPFEGKLAYLFGGAAAPAGALRAEDALAQLAAELVAHEQAMGQALPEVLRAVLADFEPEALKKRLLGGGARLFESARAWEAYARDYAQRLEGEPPWAQQLLERHFARVYARALLRAKRNRPGASSG
jgi:predicted component of type VI protein secretion system